MRWCSFLILWLVLSAASVGVGDARVFPEEISFQIKSSLASGSFELKFGESLARASDYQIKLANFGGLGMTSNQQLWSYVFKSDLSLKGQAVLEGNRKIREVFLNNECKSAMGQEQTTCFLYQEFTDGGEVDDATQTEIFADAPAIDLVSSLVVASRHAATKPGQRADFVFIFEDTTKKVALVPGGEESVQVQGKTYQAQVWTLRLKDPDYELYRFMIISDGQGYLPARMRFTDEDRGVIEFVAKEWVW